MYITLGLKKNKKKSVAQKMCECCYIHLLKDSLREIPGFHLFKYFPNSTVYETPADFPSYEPTLGAMHFNDL